VHCVVADSLVSLSPAAFAENQAATGGRRNAAEAFGDEEAEDDGTEDDGSISLGSDNTDMSGRAPAPGRAAGGRGNAAPAQGRGAAAAPAARAERRPDPEHLAHMMEQMRLTGVEQRGCCFDCVHPHFWWTCSYLGSRCIRIDLLCWTGPPTDCVPKLDPEGKIFCCGQKIPDRFFDMARQFIHYGGVLEGDEHTCTDAIYNEGVACKAAIDEAFHFEDVKPLVRFKLPFPVKQDFEDPYRPNMTGYMLNSYPHEADGNEFFFVFSASMREAAEPRRKATPQHARHAWPGAGGAAAGGGAGAGGAAAGAGGAAGAGAAGGAGGGGGGGAP